MQRSLQVNVRVRVAIVSGAVSMRVHVSDFNHIRSRMHTLLLAGSHSPHERRRGATRDAV
jgi:hypothetical protein